VASGASVGVIDENVAPGGQIYRPPMGVMNPQIQERFAKLHARGVQFRSQTTVVDAPEVGVLTVKGPDRAEDLRYESLILATGARELLLPFPGWTLPNVMGVGGLQALVKGGLHISGKRIVVSGTGPLLLTVGAYLKQKGAKVIRIAEQSPAKNIRDFTQRLFAYPYKLGQGIPLMLAIGSVLRTSSWVERANGTHALESVKLNNQTEPIDCDYLACAFGFEPNVELAMMLGCDLHRGFVEVDDCLRTTIPYVWCAGEPTGIGGVDLSEIEGKIAGFAASGNETEAKKLIPVRARWMRFAAMLEVTYALRDELKELPNSETILCRCEDVSMEEASEWSGSRAVKLHSRCGMGPCQGRICGAAGRFLFGWEHGTVRTPLVPVPLSDLMERDLESANHTD
jgi:NADPH-dependent 2,4-dienoyl-CoA reductase/sulfur reductase-like enzyme